MENKIVEFSIPGLYQYTSLNLFLLDLMDKYPEKFRENIKIGSMYGTFPCVWNGGRLNNGQFEAEDVIVATTFLNAKNIRLRYTFTNCFIDEDITKDTTGNAILNLTKDYQVINNDVIVANDCMYNYIKEKYPDFNLVLSTTMMIKELDEINKKSKDCLLIPDYEVNNNFELLSKIKKPENIELLVNEECEEGCKMRRLHYETNSMISLKKDVQMLECQNCDEKNFYRTVSNRKHYISMKDIEEKYLPLGFNKFKIAGRSTTVLNLIESYVEYLAKPEYRDEIRWDLLNHTLGV